MAERTISSEFRNVDNAETADHLIEYLRYTDSLPWTQQVKARSYTYLDLTNTDVVLDAGCGPGFDVIRMASIVRNGQVVGIDKSERMVAFARDMAKGTGLPVTFQTMDLRKLDFPDACFDKIRVERTLQILDAPGRVLDELVRVLRPGGRILCIEPDWETFVCDPGSRDTARTFFRFCSDQFADGSTGRKLYRYFRERDLTDIVVYPEPLVLHDYAVTAKLMNMEQFLAAAQEKNTLSRHEIAAWLRELKTADASGQFTFAGMMFAVVGRK